MTPSNPIGQKQLLQHLDDLAKNSRIANTYMLVGQEGVGKISIALAFINSVLRSTLGKESDAARVATNKINSLSHPDLHFSFPVNTNDKIKKDPVSNDFLEAWREMLFNSTYFSLHDWYKKIRIGNKQGIISAKEAEKISKVMSLKPYEGGYRFMVVWMAEKMNPSASNKLLKLLEEPPKKAVFLLLCENEAAVLGTIRSRCQKIGVGPIASEDIALGLKAGFETEKLLAEEIAKKAKGNYRAACLLVENQSEARVEVGVVAAHALHDGRFEGRLGRKDLTVDLKGQPSARLDLGGRPGTLHLLANFTSAELNRLGLSLPPRLNFKEFAQGIDCLDAHPVEPDGLLESFTVILRARIDLGSAVHEFAQRNTPSIVAHLHPTLSVNLDADFPAVPHHEFIHRIVDDLLQQEVDAIVLHCAVTKLSDVHARAEANMLPPVEGLDVFFGITR